MSKPFDPYHVWLGIPAKDQPPNHYRLLGIETFEDNADVIDAAAMRQTSYLRGMSSGEYRRESQQILNEVSAARRCLLDTTKKAAYDAELAAAAASPATDSQTGVTALPAEDEPSSPPSFPSFPSFTERETSPPVSQSPVQEGFPQFTPSEPNAEPSAFSFSSGPTETGGTPPTPAFNQSIQPAATSVASRVRKSSNVPAWQDPKVHMIIGGLALVGAIVMFSMKGCNPTPPGNRVIEEKELLNEDGSFFGTTPSPPTPANEPAK